jgi:hypothetical protein
LISLDSQEFEVVISNLSASGMLNINLMRCSDPVREVNPMGINQINELNPRQSYAVQCDQNASNKPMKLCTVKNSKGEASLTVRQDLKAASEDPTKAQGTSLFISVIPQLSADTKTLRAQFAKTVWRCPPSGLFVLTGPIPRAPSAALMAAGLGESLALDYESLPVRGGAQFGFDYQFGGFGGPALGLGAAGLRVGESLPVRGGARFGFDGEFSAFGGPAGGLGAAGSGVGAVGLGGDPSSGPVSPGQFAFGATPSSDTNAVAASTSVQSVSNTVARAGYQNQAGRYTIPARRGAGDSAPCGESGEEDASAVGHGRAQYGARGGARGGGARGGSGDGAGGAWHGDAGGWGRGYAEDEDEAYVPRTKGARGEPAAKKGAAAAAAAAQPVPKREMLMAKSARGGSRRHDETKKAALEAAPKEGGGAQKKNKSVPPLLAAKGRRSARKQSAQAAAASVAAMSDDGDSGAEEADEDADGEEEDDAPMAAGDGAGGGGGGAAARDMYRVIMDSKSARLEYGDREVNVSSAETGNEYAYELAARSCVLGLSVAPGLVWTPADRQMTREQVAAAAKELVTAYVQRKYADFLENRVYDSDSCVICLELGPDVALFPCGHLCTHRNCSSSLAICPLCRAEIIARLQPLASAEAIAPGGPKIIIPTLLPPSLPVAKAA